MDSLWGRRGVVKAVSLWLPLAVFVSAAARPRPAGACFQVLAAVACYVLASILGNDLADRGDDRAAGKQRWIQRLPGGLGVSVVVLLAGLGLLALALPGSPPGALAVYVAAIALGLAYSVRPIRLKQRGLLGLLAYSTAGTLAYAVLPWAWLRAGWRPLAVVAPAVLLDKWVNLHFHQILDRDADRERACRTYAVRAGLERARRTLRWAAGLASACMLAVLAFLAFELPRPSLALLGAVGAAAVAAGLYARVARQRAAKPSTLLRELPGHYLGLTYALFRILPALLFARLAIEEPAIWTLAGAAGIWALVESWHSVRYRYQ